MDAGHGKQLGDIVSKKGGSAAEDYYRYMLLKEKVKNGLGDESLLTFQSEKEAIEMSILSNLLNITESSPEFSQVVDITGSRDRYEQARILAEVVYDKARAEQILSWYTPNKTSLTDHFTARTNKAVTIRSNKGSDFSASLNKYSGEVKPVTPKWVELLTGATDRNTAALTASLQRPAGGGS